MAELVAENVSFSYEGRSVLKDINLVVRTGELVVCLGENASGKTTLLRLLSGLFTPCSGRVIVKGAETESPKSHAGILFQNPDHQMMAATVEEEIALGLELRGTAPSDIRQRVDELLQRFELDALKSHPPQALSGGQTQRVALAAIMATRPYFLMLDEPDSYLDAPSRRELMRAVDEIRPDCGIIWSGPHPRHLPQADRHFLLQSGSLIEFSRAELERLTLTPPVAV